jgi:hypothetical protein
MPRKKPSKRQKEAAALLREVKLPNVYRQGGRVWFLVEPEPHLKIYAWLRRVAREKETKFRFPKWKALERFEKLQRQFPSEKAPQIFERLTKELNGGGKTHRKQIRSVRKQVDRERQRRKQHQASIDDFLRSVGETESLSSPDGGIDQPSREYDVEAKQISMEYEEWKSLHGPHKF